MNLITSDVENMKAHRLVEIQKNQAAWDSWFPMWKKHEYIHKFRKGWRDRGVAQGSALSPLLSVLPLILLEDLKAVGIYYISYADDGLLYGFSQGDYGIIMQRLLDSNLVGAMIHPDKSRWVKKDGVWLHKLKFVGLIYDP